MKLYLYFARRYLWHFIWIFLVFTALTALLEMIEVLHRFSGKGLGFFNTLHLTALKVPKSMYDILPLVMILAALTMFLGLAKTNELVVTRAAGRSALRTLIAPITVALLIGLFAITAFNPIVAATTRQYEAIANRFHAGSGSVVSVSAEGLWLRQGGSGGQAVIRAERANLDGTRLFGVTFYGFTRDGVPSYRIEAEDAELTPGAWRLDNAKQWAFRQGLNAETTANRATELRVPSDLTRDQIRDGFGTPSSIPIWELPGFIQRLKNSGFSARRHEVWLQTELARPLLLVTMVLIGATFTMRHTRFGRTGLMILSALLLGFGLYFIRNFALILGENGQIPVLLAAWAPPLAGILLSLGALLHLEDG